MMLLKVYQAYKAAKKSKVWLGCYAITVTMSGMCDMVSGIHVLLAVSFSSRCGCEKTSSTRVT